MVDQRRYPPVEKAERIVAAMQAMKDAKVERDLAIADALNSGGSVRMVADVAGMSTNAIMAIARANGYPSKKIVAEREAKAAENARWQQLAELGRQAREQRLSD
jgi:hypothetical protein